MLWLLRTARLSERVLLIDVDADGVQRRAAPVPGHRDDLAERDPTGTRRELQRVVGGGDVDGRALGRAGEQRALRPDRGGHLLDALGPDDERLADRDGLDVDAA